MKYFNNGAWHKLSYKVGDTLPIGSIISFGGSTAPDGWLLCDGSLVSRTQYAALFSVIGTSFGAGDGSLTFAVPDLRGKVNVGKSTDTEFNTLGKTGGEKTHTLTTSEMPSHSHSLNKNVPYGIPYNNTSGASAGAGGTTYYGESYSPFSIGSTGGGGSHNNLQPYTVTNYIIKAYQSVGVVAKIKNEKTSTEADTYSCDYINTLATDYIVEEGTKGIWTYRKWNSGMAECWGTASVTTTFTSTWGSLYAMTSGAIARQSYPFTFKERPNETVRAFSSANAMWLYSESDSRSVNSTTQTGMYNCVRPTSTTTSNVVKFDYYVMGKWK